MVKGHNKAIKQPSQLIELLLAIHRERLHTRLETLIKEYEEKRQREVWMLSLKVAMLALVLYICARWVMHNNTYEGCGRRVCVQRRSTS